MEGIEGYIILTMLIAWLATCAIESTRRKIGRK